MGHHLKLAGEVRLTAGAVETALSNGIVFANADTTMNACTIAETMQIDKRLRSCARPAGNDGTCPYAIGYCQQLEDLYPRKADENAWLDNKKSSC